MYNPDHKGFYEKIVDKNRIKKKDLVAVQRKLLKIIYILDKNRTVFDPKYENSVSVTKIAYTIQADSKATLIEQIQKTNGGLRVN